MRRLLAAAVLAVAVLAAWASPAAAEKFGAEGYACPGTRRGAVIDRDEQRAWLCEGKRIVRWMPVTTAISQPDPGVYPIYAKDAQTRSNFGTQVSTLDRFVAFTFQNGEIYVGLITIIVILGTLVLRPSGLLGKPVAH